MGALEKECWKFQPGTTAIHDLSPRKHSDEIAKVIARVVKGSIANLLRANV